MSGVDALSDYARAVQGARRSRELSQRDLAVRLGVPATVLRKIERGELPPDAGLAARIAGELGVPSPGDSGNLEGLETRVVAAAAAAPTIGHTLPGQLIGTTRRGYRFVTLLGTGGFGAVYRAEQTSVGRDVAIKVVHPQLANDLEFVRRFEVEAELVARLEHPHIVPLYDFWREPGAAFMVMRYLRGGSLADRMMDGAIPAAQLLQILRQVALALRVAHRAGVIHRDLKPANILLDDDGNACLADFGVAKQLDGNSARTQAGDIVGSLAYCSPEQIRGTDVGPAADVYAFGLVCYELLAGRRAYTGPGREALIHQHLHEPPPSVRAHGADLPEALDAVFARALAKDAVARIGDPLQLVAELEAVLRSTGSWLGSLPSHTDDATLSGHTRALIDDGDNPFVGLAAFDEGDARNFFGREALVEQLVARLADTGALARALFVVGASGSGKSSVVRAGLLPAVRAGRVGVGSREWLVSTLVPGADPWAALAQALLRVATRQPGDLEAMLRGDALGLARAVDRCLAGSDGTELLLVVDQFEELWTLTADAQDRERFINLLTTALLEPHSRLRVVFTLRADFLDRPLAHPDLADFLRERAVLVPAMSLDEVERAIVGPARRVGLGFEPGLVAAILAEVGSQAGALPLLQFALSELFVRRSGRELTLAAFREIGGIRGALVNRAEAAYDALDARAQLAARQMFLRLTQLGEGSEDTRRRVVAVELDALGGDDAGHAAFVAAREAYARARLLTLDRDAASGAATVEVAHEALLRGWARLREWLQSSRADLRLQRQLADAARQWEAAGRDSSFLAGGGRLAQFRLLPEHGLVALTAHEASFLDASVAHAAAVADAESARQARELEQARQLALEQQRAAEAAAASAAVERRGRQRLRVVLAGLSALLALALWQGWQLSTRGEELERETARANQEATSARALSDFWANLFRQADPNRAQGRELTVREVLDQGMADAGKQLVDAPLVQARLLRQMGESYRSLGVLDQADAALAAAAVALARVPDAPLAQRIDLALERGRVLADLGRGDDALGELGQALRWQEQAGVPAAERATTLNITASVYNDQSRFLDAEPLLRQVLASRREGGEPRDLATSLNNLGFTLLQTGRVGEARALFEETLALRREIYPGLHTETAITEMNLGVAERDLGEFDRARTHFDAAERDLGTLFAAETDGSAGPRHPILAGLALHRGVAAQLAGEPAAALAAFDRSIDLYESLFGSDAPALATPLRERGVVASELGRHAQARADIERSCAITARVRGADTIFHALCRLRLAQALELSGDRAAARAAFDGVPAALARAPAGDLRLAVERATALMLDARFADREVPRDDLRALLEPAREMVRARRLLAAIAPAG
jgi:DNA-binding XRE family transcriptional regulator